MNIQFIKALLQDIKDLDYFCILKLKVKIIMPELSERAVLMPSSPIRKLAPYANEAKARGLKVYHLNIGQPDLNSPDIALEAIKKFDHKILEYSPSDGFLSLREKLVEYYDQYQIKLKPDDIIVTSGGSEAVLFAFL